MMLPHTKQLAKKSANIFFLPLFVSTSVDSISEEEKTESGLASHITSKIVNVLQHSDLMKGAGKNRKMILLFSFFFFFYFNSFSALCRAVG